MVADTNILVSAVLTDGPSRRFLRQCIKGEVVLVGSAALLQELTDVLRRPKFGLTADDVRDVLSAIKTIAEIVAVRSAHHVVPNDPNDDVVVNTAVDGRADYVVSGERELLAVGAFQGIAILTVAAFLEHMARRH